MPAGGDGTSYRRVRQLQITASRNATDIFAGEYRSAFRGRGLEFDQVREYQPGDDVRSIDWNVTARAGTPYVKRFVEERELSVVLVLDRSPSMRFGTVRSTKLETALEACALLGFAAEKSHDRVALLTVGDGGFRYLPFGKGRRHTLRLIKEAAQPELAGAQPDELAAALGHLERILKGRAVVCLFSDFIEGVPVRPLASVAARHDTIAFAVSDPAELELPRAGLLTLADPETGSVTCIDSSDESVRRQYRESAQRRRRERKADLLRSGADYLELATAAAPVHRLIAYFQARCSRSGTGAERTGPLTSPSLPKGDRGDFQL